MRFHYGKFPEFLGATFIFDFEGVNNTSKITTKQDKGTFDLIIHVSKLNDTGFYFCVKVEQFQMEILSGIFLIIQGKTSAMLYIIYKLSMLMFFLCSTGSDSAVSVESPDLSGTVDSGASVELQCLVQTESVQCFEEHKVLWFKSGLDQSGSGLVYAQRNSSGPCDRSPEDHGPHKCYYTFSKTVNDSETYHCAVAACGQIHFGNKTKVNVKETGLFLKLLCH